MLWSEKQWVAGYKENIMTQDFRKHIYEEFHKNRLDLYLLWILCFMVYYVVIENLYLGELHSMVGSGHVQVMMQ